MTLGHAGVQFVAVTNGQLVNGRKLQLPHAVAGIAYHRGALYLTSGTALYHYTLTGTLVRKLYEDTIRGSTSKCNANQGFFSHLCGAALVPSFCK